MKNNFVDIQKRIDQSFSEFITNLFRLEDDPLKYYYWSADFFYTVGALSFQYFPLTNSQKETINSLGQRYFGEKDIYFGINVFSHRHDLIVNNFIKVFTESSKTGQTNRYEYIKEFILWEILKDINATTRKVSKQVCDLQKKNFLITYLNYLLEFTKKPTFPELSGYIKYTLTSKGEELGNKLSDLEAKGVENILLREKIERLYVRREIESKIHFVFSRNQGGDKEELRELLEVMGREETGKLYRGQANSSWKLDSSLTREPKYLEFESEMYYEILSLKPDSFSNDHSVYERMITMQHFGMPTRLMDITRNPLVAIFFACNNLQRSDSDGVVYTFSKENTELLNFEDERLKGLKRLFDDSFKLNGDQKEFLYGVSFIKGVAKNQRINNQSGDFIFVGTGEDIKQKLRELPVLTIIIDASTKAVLLEQLESLNIHGGAVYPDLTHMSNYIREKYKVDVKKVPDELTIDIDNKPVKKRTMVRTKRSTPERRSPTTLTSTYDFKTFWDKENQDRLVKFTGINGLLDVEKAKKMLENLIENDRIPERKEVAKIMHYRPKLLEYQLKVDPIINKMVEFANALKQESK